MPPLILNRSRAARLLISRYSSSVLLSKKARTEMRDDDCGGVPWYVGDGTTTATS